MSNLAKTIEQCRKPSGEQGREVADKMNEYHYDLTTWGLEKISVENDNIILDIGCGGGRTVNRLVAMVPEGKVFGVDYSQDCVTWSKEYNGQLIKEGKVEILHGNVLELPFEKDKFHIITAVETIYFWPEIVECFKEVKRVLNPTGKFLIINEMYTSEKFKQKNQEHVSTGSMNIYGPEQLKELLKQAGFYNIKIDLMEERNWLCCIADATCC